MGTIINKDTERNASFTRFGIQGNRENTRVLWTWRKFVFLSWFRTEIQVRSHLACLFLFFTGFSWLFAIYWSKNVKHCWVHRLICKSFNIVLTHFSKHNVFCAFTAMSSSCKSKHWCFKSDIHRLLLAAEAGQKADILTYYSGHLGPCSLNQNQPHRDTKQVIWKLSESQDENPNRRTLLQRQTKAPTYVKKKKLKESPSEFTAGTALVESESRQAQATDHSSHANRREELSLPKIVHSSSNSLQVHPRALSYKTSNFPPSPKQKKQLYSSHSDQEGLNNEDQLKTKQRCGRQFIAKQDLCAGINVAEVHERKLQKVRIVTQISCN